MYTSNLVAALAVVSVAAAQSASLCSQATATINSQADAAQYTTCSTYKGDVLIGPLAAGTISFDGPSRIDGNLIVRNAGNLVSFGSTTVGSITKSLTLFNLTLLSTFTTSRLTEVDTLDFEALPFLGRLTFTQAIRKARSVRITNTFLESLQGLDLTTAETLDINNNGRLKEFSSRIGNVSESLIIDANNKALQVSFPSLVWAANATFRNASSVSIPALTTVNGSIGFYGNYFDGLVAPNLTSVGSSLAFVANSAIKNITLPVLKSVGGAALIANNSALTDISFAALEDVGGAIDFSGNFSTPSLPKLNDIKGGFNVQSTAQIDCTQFESLRGNVIQGVYTCKTTTDAKSGLNADGTTSGDGSSPTGTSKKGSAASFGVNGAVAGLSVVGSLLSMLL